MDNLEWLTNWFKSNCDEDWEHSYGIMIRTLDNPGWSLQIDLTDTNQEGSTLHNRVFVNDNDWYDIVCDGITFKALGDYNKLNILIECFRIFVNG
jgi:hypothetical protein